MGDQVGELMTKLVAMSKISKDDNTLLKEIELTRKKIKDDPELETMYGLILTRLGRYTDAEKVLDSALELKPGSAWANYHKANLYAKTGKNEHALECITKACSKKPKRADFLVEKADIEYELNKVKDSFHSYDLALRAGDKTGWAWLGKSRILVHLNMLEEAVEAAKNAAKQNPQEEAFRKQEDFIKQKLSGA